MDMDRQVEELLAALDERETNDTPNEGAGKADLPPACADSADTTAGTSKKPRKTARRIADVVTLAVIACVIIAVFALSGGSDDGFRVFGYSGFTMQGGGMQNDIPDGSLVLTQTVDSERIAIHDDITYIDDENSFVTDRVAEIIENHGEGNDRAFLTRGTENSVSDGHVVLAEDVVGVVRSVIPVLGGVLIYISENIGMFMLIALLILLNIRLMSEHRKRKRRSP